MKGFTLVEIMISVVVLGVGLTLVSNSYLAALRGINAATNNIQASILIREKFAEAELNGLVNGVSASSVSEEFKRANKQYKYTQNIAETAVPKYLKKYFLTACAKVSWQEQNNEKNVKFSTYLPKKKE